MNTGFAILTVSQLNLYARSLLESDDKLSRVFVRGEISNFTNHYRSGHFYLSLKDENAVIRAVMFRGNAQRLPFMPRDGMKVIVMGRASIYDRDGQFQLYIDDMQPDGVGALHVAFEQLKQKLLDEGLFDPTRKKPLPAYPQRIGVITSPTGAALQDILTILSRRWPLAEVLLIPVAVQGAAAPEQIVRAITHMSRVVRPDVMIVGRGGGSIEELWAFNDEQVARAIATSDVPVVSAVGHETDFTIADFAADVRSPTPSAAAELVSPDGAAVADLLASCRLAMRRAVSDKLDSCRRRYADIASARALRTPIHIIDLQRMKLDMLSGRQAAGIRSRVSRARAGFSELAARLDALSPLRVLARGYAIPTAPDGSAVTGVAALTPGGEFFLRMRDGTARCRALAVDLSQPNREGKDPE